MTDQRGRIRLHDSMSRRAFLRRGGETLLALGASQSLGALLAGCDRPRGNGAVEDRSGAAAGAGYGRTAAEASGTSGPLREFRLVSEVAEVDLGPLGVHPRWVYDGTLPGPELRVREGDRLRVILENRLPEETTVHWHGLPVPNPMDGVPGVTQDPVSPGERFVYEFPAEPAGSYLYHTHVGLQLDRGLYGPLVVEEATPHVEWDREHTLVLDDFTPAEPRVVMGPGMGMMGGMPQGPDYEAFLMNGRPATDPPLLEVAHGERVRLRLMNPASQTTFRVALAGHRLLVTHTDGRPVEPVEVDSLEIGMGERYDVIVQADDPGAWNLVAAALEPQSGTARAVLRYRDARQAGPPEGQVPEGLRRDARVLQLSDLRSIELDGGRSRRADRTVDLMLTGGGMMMSPRGTWTIDRQAWPDADPLTIVEGERVRVRMVNHSPMRHPMHLHGFFFRVHDALKETVIVPPHMGRIEFDFLADNPGDWFFHCHDLYHMESGMARVFRYG